MWQFEATPYLWAAGLDGSVKVDNRPKSGLGVEQSFSDILSVLDFALMGTLEARKGSWGAVFDGVYFRVSDEGSVTGPLGFASLGASATITQQMYTLLATYRAVEESSAVDLVVGLRTMSVRWNVGIQASVPVLPATERRFLQTERWVDPVVGARIQHPLDARWTLVGYADIGGFGAGSDLSWQLLGGVNYSFTPSVIGRVGYRYVSVDYDKQAFTYDMAIAGVFLGIGIRW